MGVDTFNFRKACSIFSGLGRVGRVGRSWSDMLLARETGGDNRSGEVFGVVAQYFKRDCLPPP
jgi:hypothetical protein